MLDTFYKNKRVFLTGHTGFKGSWLSEWLLMLGAEVYGYSLQPETVPALFDQLDLPKRIHSHLIGDIRDEKVIETAIKEVQPDVVFHLAAQPLVRESYHDPVTTYATNVMGTVNVLEAIRTLQDSCSVVVVTTDKCYENKEWMWGYRENDAIGGHDPYSASKGCAELIVQSYRKSFFSFSDSPVRISSARAGNVIGGGDWASDRIIPDCMRALSRTDSIIVRNPGATRPWQHVLDPLYGYLLLGKSIHPSLGPVREGLVSGMNFGPDVQSNCSVESLVTEVLSHWPGQWIDQSDPNAPHEAGLLSLSVEKAWHLLHWRPCWSFKQTVAQTVKWYRSVMEEEMDSSAIIDLTRQQITDYTSSFHNTATKAYC